MTDWRKEKIKCQKIIEKWIGRKCRKCFEIITENEIITICQNRKLVKMIISGYSGGPCGEDCLIDHFDQHSTDKKEFELMDLDEFESNLDNNLGNHTGDFFKAYE